MSTRFSEDVRPITDLRTRASAIVEHARLTRRPVLLTRRSRGVAVLLDLGEYERLVDRAEFVDAVEAGARAAAAGDVLDHDAAVDVLESFGRTDA